MIKTFTILLCSIIFFCGCSGRDSAFQAKSPILCIIPLDNFIYVIARGELGYESDGIIKGATIYQYDSKHNLIKSLDISTFLGGFAIGASQLYLTDYMSSRLFILNLSSCDITSVSGIILPRTFKLALNESQYIMSGVSEFGIFTSDYYASNIISQRSDVKCYTTFWFDEILAYSLNVFGKKFLITDTGLENETFLYQGQYIVEHVEIQDEHLYFMQKNELHSYNIASGLDKIVNTYSYNATLLDSTQDQLVIGGGDGLVELYSLNTAISNRYKAKRWITFATVDGNTMYLGYGTGDWEAVAL